MKKRAFVILALTLVAVGAYAGRLFVLASSQSGISTGTLPGSPHSPDPFTISAWVRVSTTNNNMAIVSLQTNDSTGGSGRRFLGVLGSSGFSGQWAVDAVDAGTRVTGSKIVPGQLYHVAAVFASTTDRRLYVDGVLDGSDADAPTTPVQITKALVGMRFTTGTSYGQFFDGVISEVAIWNVELTAAQIAGIAKGMDPRAVSSTQPIVYWPMRGNASPEPGWHGTAPSLTLSNSPAATNHPIIVSQ